MRKNRFIIFICIIFIFLLNLGKNIYVFNFKYKTSDTYEKIKCMVIQKEKVEEKKISYLVKYNSNKFILNIYNDTYSNTNYDGNSDINEFANFMYGDILEFRGKIIIPQKLNNPFEYDYKKYLNSNNIVANITTYNVVKSDKKVGNVFVKLGYIIRENLDKNIDEKMTIKEAGLFKSMMYGNDLELSKDIKESFSENGISHMLAVSGLHLMYIIKILNMITKDMNKKIIIILNFITIFLFCIISSMSISVIRASIMSFISIIDSNKKIYEEKDNKEKYSCFFVYKKLLIAFIIIIIYNPYSIFNLSFQMSFLATFGIITYNNLVYSYFVVVLKINKKYKYIIEILSLSISANIFILPLQIYYYGRFELISFFSNILLSPILSFEFLLGFLSLFLAFVPFVSDIFISANIVVLKLIIFITTILKKINYFTIYIPRFNYLELFLIYSTILFETIKKYVTLLKKSSRRYARIIIVIVTIFTFLYSISMYIYRMYFEEYIYFFNVGQGNMAIIRDNRKVILIDIGSTSKNVASNVLESFLKAKGIYKVDAIFITHMHEDHVNGIYEVAKKIKIKSVVYSVPKTTKKGEYEKITELLENKNIPGIEVIQNDNIKIGDVNITTLMPLHDKVIISKDMLNSNSSIFLLEKDDKKYLFMGDSTIETEETFLDNIDNEVKNKLKKLSAIQIGHHGSNTSSSEELLKQINPCTAIISSEKKRYGHPHISTIEMLKKYKFDIKITEECGAIKVE